MPEHSVTTTTAKKAAPAARTKARPLTAKGLALAAVFAAFTAVGAHISIPLPMLSITLQTLFVMLAGMTLPRREAGLAMLCYILMGLFGLPVYTSGGGLAYIFKPSFGFVLSFCPGAMLASWYMARGKRSYWRGIIAGLLALAVIYGIGLAYYWLMSTLYLGKTVELRSMMMYCFLLPVPGDLASCAVAAAVAVRLWKTRLC